MRKLMIGTVGALAVTALAVTMSSAGAGPRLAGAFDVNGTVQDSDFVPPIPPGSKTVDTYTFKPTCAHGGCAKVKLTRASGGRNVKSTLNRTGPRRYKGTEGPVAYVCVDPLGNPGQFTGTNVVRVTKVKHGHATRIAGTSKIKITGCTETFENSKFTGKPAH